MVSTHRHRSSRRRCEIRVGVEHRARHDGSGVRVVITVVGDARERHEPIDIVSRVDIGRVGACEAR